MGTIGDGALMSLEATVRARAGNLLVDAELAVATGEVVAVLGPNGAGKTTLLRALAGLLPREAGRVVLDGEVVEDVAAGTWVPPHRRGVGVVFQDALLFPHLSVVENVAFGLRARGRRRIPARQSATEWLARVGLAAEAGRRPATLSGGEAQRVAVARALATEPRLLLLDEPFAALDLPARAALRRDLRAHLAGFQGTRVVVTHDPLEAAVLADRMVVLEEGRVVQTGPPADVAARPRTRYVADLVGVNLFVGRGMGDHVELAGGAVLVTPDAGRGDVLATVHPRAVALHRERPAGTPRNVWVGTVGGVDREGGRVRVVVHGPVDVVAEVTAGAADELRLDEGGPCWVAVKATEVAVYPA